MNKLFLTDKHNDHVDFALLIARVGIGAMMLTHGIPKLQTLLSGAPVEFVSAFGLSATTSMGLAVFAEVVCSVLIILGLGTRLAVLPLIITMIIALVSVHAADPFGKQEPALHYLLVYLVLLVAGSGRISVDRLLHSGSFSRNEISMKKSTVVV